MSLHRLSDAQQAALKKLQSQDFSASDAVMSRCISTAISLLWTEEQIREKGEKIAGVIKKVHKSVAGNCIGLFNDRCVLLSGSFPNFLL